jgi:hypothetical protein
MPFIAAPGVAMASVFGFIGNQPWASTIHWADSGVSSAWSLAQITALAETFWTGLTTTMRGDFSTNVSCHHIDAVDQTNTSPQYWSTTHLPVQGTASEALEPSSMSFVLQYKIAARYRGGKPRGYYPVGSMTHLADESHWDTTYAQSIATHYATVQSSIRTALIAAGMVNPTHVVPRFTYSYTDDPTKHKYLKEKTGFVGAPVVNSYVGRLLVGSQRRRLTL